jgi:hypothetical protein
VTQAERAEQAAALRQLANALEAGEISAVAGAYTLRGGNTVAFFGADEGEPDMIVFAGALGFSVHRAYAMAQSPRKESL